MAIAKNPTPNAVTEDDIRIMPNMVRWFDPVVIFKILRPVVISSIFGSYADRRLMQAALDQRPDEEHFKTADIRSYVDHAEDGAVWVDFIADTGDGFASTYTVTWLQSQPSLNIDGVELHRGNLLLLGGDQVYPDATYANYINRFKTVFDWAYPDTTKVADELHPRVYAIPGNHDWYDGLNYFLAFFCSAKPWKLGNWRAFQRRSYYAIRITDEVWVWGIDIQLSEKVDSPQAEYFKAIAARMPIGSTIVLVTAVPGWYDADSAGFGCLGYVEKIAHKAERDLKVSLVLSGDIHHYARYECKDAGTQFVTSGGGGAFLHATNNLIHETTGSWGDKFGGHRKITLATTKATGGKDEQLACYPSVEQSHELLRGLWRTPVKNWYFTMTIGLTYAFVGLLCLMWNDLRDYSFIHNLPWIVTMILLGLVLVANADKSKWVSRGKVIFDDPADHRAQDFWSTVARNRHWLLGGAQAALHAIALTALSHVFYSVLTKGHFIVPELSFWTWSFNLCFLALMTIIGGLVGASILALYLYGCCRFLGVHANDAMSAQSLDSFRGFLRLKIER